MIHLLWGLLNLALFFYFLYLCLQALKLVGGNLGRGAAFVFGLGLFSFVCVSRHDEAGLKDKVFTFNITDSLDKSQMKSESVNLDRTLINKRILTIRYSYHVRTRRPVPIDAFSWTEGFEMAVQWKPEVAWTSDITDSSTYKYTVNGSVIWELLGVGIFTQSKLYEGSITLE